ncbi:hypothetical protein [Streptomyces sp. A244]|uniref:hypothetical protein n=1 Tax=Streptomyces sp. A244 TaxID=2137016 RepID=UPI0021598EF6|nr:hypothetical protein [Streptomyces sp. A244]
MSIQEADPFRHGGCLSEGSDGVFQSALGGQADSNVIESPNLSFGVTLFTRRLMGDLRRLKAFGGAPPEVEIDD